MNQEEKTIRVSGSITVDELAAALGTPVTTLIGELFKNGIVATINQRLDFETASIIIEELGFKDVKLVKKSAEASAGVEKHVLSDQATPRPPIVAVMGHVDHGKTSLLDTLLHKKTAAGEAGGITQHISAYQVEHNKRLITFLDTPGHEAFAAIRQHGARLTDIVVIVVAADDGVKPQTVEAIKFAESSNAKIIVAINKIDKDAANIDMVKAQLASEYNLSPEEWGGSTVMVPISAKTGENLNQLLDMILLTADVEDLRADFDVPAEGLVIESHMETGKGSVVNLLVEQGELKIGEFIVAGPAYAKVRTMLDWHGKPKGKATPSTPVTITGFKSLPQFGDRFIEVPDEKSAKKLALENSNLQTSEAATANVTGSDLLRMMDQSTDQKEFKVVIKADVLGSLTSVIDSLKLIDTKGLVNLSIIGQGIGPVTENDLYLAGPDAIVYGFNVEVPAAIKRLASRDKIKIKTFRVIYELLDDVKHRMESLLDTQIIETEVGSLEIKGIFRTTKDEIIAGGTVTGGTLSPGNFAKAFRGKDQIASDLEVTNVQIGKQDATSIQAGETGGLSLKTTGKTQLEIGDTLKFFTREQKTQKL